LRIVRFDFSRRREASALVLVLIEFVQSAQITSSQTRSIFTFDSFEIGKMSSFVIDLEASTFDSQYIGEDATSKPYMDAIERDKIL
jgi:hypothetical protein